MSETRGARYSPRHPNANIHGMVDFEGNATCATNGEAMCTGCCYSLHIVSRGNPTVTLKEAGVNCPAQIPAKGCGHVINGRQEKRFEVCPQYHCSSDIQKAKNSGLPANVVTAAKQRLFFCNTASMMFGEIGSARYNESNKRLDI